MTMNPLPPQAYTKDTLLKAYAWLMHQSPQIREMATTPDILVSLFLKATRDGESSLDSPSITNFKNELKSLAGLMGELDKPQQKSHRPSAKVEKPHYSLDSQTIQEVPEEPVVTKATMAPSSKFDLDNLSLEMINETKLEFNLSSEQEALRMLIKIGFTRSKLLIK